uniref:Peroxisomal biosis factor 13 n=1 Tax=Gorilla gorilla gorilla TaxID=9595 RepID=A0A2I2YW58_GORGO
MASQPPPPPKPWETRRIPGAGPGPGPGPTFQMASLSLKRRLWSVAVESGICPATAPTGSKVSP